MKYKQEVQEKLNQADQLLFTILEGMRDRKITVELTVDTESRPALPPTGDRGIVDVGLVGVFGGWPVPRFA